MSETKVQGKHTPGPWTLGQNGDHCAKNHAICSGSKVIAKVYGDGYPIGAGWSPKSEADARLIAAAPELLEACKLLMEDTLEFHEAIEDAGQSHANCGWCAVKAAIAKAEESHD